MIFCGCVTEIILCYNLIIIFICFFRRRVTWGANTTNADANSRQTAVAGGSTVDSVTIKIATMLLSGTAAFLLDTILFSLTVVGANTDTHYLLTVNGVDLKPKKCYACTAQPSNPLPKTAVRARCSSPITTATFANFGTTIHERAFIIAQTAAYAVSVSTKTSIIARPATCV